MARPYVTAALCVAAVLALAGCASSSSGEVTTPDELQSPSVCVTASPNAGAGAYVKADTNQSMLDSFDAKILNLVDPGEGATNVSPEPRYAGYAGLANSSSTATVTVYWVGIVPADIRAIINAAPSRITVRVRSGSIGFAREQAAIKTIMNERTSYSNAKLSISSAWPSLDGKGVRVGYLSTDCLVSAAQLAQLRQKLEALSGVPVTLFADQVYRPL